MWVNRYAHIWSYVSIIRIRASATAKHDMAKDQNRCNDAIVVNSYLGVDQTNTNENGIKWIRMVATMNYHECDLVSNPSDLNDIHNMYKSSLSADSRATIIQRWHPQSLVDQL